MMRELGGVFGIALAVAVFAAVGTYASPTDFLDGFAPAIGVVAGLSLAGAIVALGLPGRRQAAKGAPPAAAPALEAKCITARLRCLGRAGAQASTLNEPPHRCPGGRAAGQGARLAQMP